MGDTVRGPRTCTLPDGRTLAWHEFGAAGGTPVLFFPGSSASGAAGRALTEPAAANGVRLIGVDRPGLGHSSPAPHRRIADWGTDVEALADHLQIGTFGVLGHSGGGTHALAVAHALPQRAIRTVVGAALGPYREPWMRARGMLRPGERAWYWALSHTQQPLQRLFGLGDVIARRVVGRRTLDTTSGAPDAVHLRQHPDQARALEAATLDGIRQGLRWFVQDLGVLLEPWGFAPEAVTGAVTWWHGQEDHDVTFASGDETARRLRNCRFDAVPNAGHLLLYDRAAEILAGLHDELVRAGGG